MGIRSLAVVVVALVWISLAPWAAADVVLSVVSTAPTRAHFVAAGTSTSFVLAASNTAGQPATVAVRIHSVLGAFGDWHAVLSRADEIFRPVGGPSSEVVVTIPPGQTVRLVALLSPHQALVEGAEGGAAVGAWVEGSLAGSVELRARVRNRPKVYYVAIDGCGRGYLSLNRKGQPFDGTGERLMPRASDFAARSARMAAASSVLPAVTDPNHSAALTGAWAGTLGVYQVKGQYRGIGPDGREVRGEVSRDALRWGLDGQRVTSLFDVAKDPALGGVPSAFTVLITGKDWLAELFRDHALDLVAHGSERPNYVPRPWTYRLGDPPSDDDPEEDQEGTNVGPRQTRHRFDTEARLIGNRPAAFPEDRWLGEAAIRIIQAEDPDVLYLDLAAADPAQHVFGAADRPHEWTDPGTPTRLWDDENVYNSGANRDPVLDIVHEADWNFGLVTDTLDARQVLGRAFVVLMSDHGHLTAMNTPATLIDPGKILLDGGITEADIERIANRGQLGYIALTDPAQSPRVEALLESYELLDPVAGERVKPLMVINRQEMDSGVDGAFGVFGADGGVGNHRGELYSEWSIDAPSTDNSKVRWPDLFMFTRGHFRTKVSSNLASAPGNGPPFNGVHGAPSSGAVLLIVAGPGIQPGVYDRAASLVDIGATLFHLLGVAAPGSVDGRVLDEILYR